MFYINLYAFKSKHLSFFLYIIYKVNLNTNIQVQYPELIVYF